MFYDIYVKIKLLLAYPNPKKAWSPKGTQLRICVLAPAVLENVDYLDEGN